MPEFSGASEIPVEVPITTLLTKSVALRRFLAVDPSPATNLAY